MPEQFPLIIWENTEDYKKEYEEARSRLESLRGKLGARGFKDANRLNFHGFDRNGEPEFWLNYSVLFNHRICKNSKEAADYALRHAATIRGSLDDLESYVRGEGPIFDETMDRLGYRRHAAYKHKWVKKRKGDKGFVFVSKEKEEIIEGGELERLTSLMTVANSQYKMDETWTLTAGKRMIHATLNWNPFHGGSYEQESAYFSDVMGQKGYIATNQDGFKIDAKNIRLKEITALYIKTIRPNDNYSEFVWPRITTLDKLIELGKDLAKRGKAEKDPFESIAIENQ